jgi:hypothetical protein
MDGDVRAAIHSGGMWIFTTIGFFSVVQKPGQEHLTVRARVKEDLDALRQKLPELGPTRATPERDYAYRATVAHADLARALAGLASDIDYDNFKSEVADVQGIDRELVYSRVWKVLNEGLRPLDKAPRRKGP